MADTRAAWDEVGSRLAAIGKQVKDRFDANAAFGAEEEERVNTALRGIADALDAGFTALGDSLRDEAIRDELKQASTAIGDAITTTFNDVADEIRRAVRPKE